MTLENGEQRVTLNGIEHWLKVEGAENQTIPLLLIHGGPGGNHYTFERTIGPRLAENRTLIYYEQRGSGRSAQPQSEGAYTIPELIDDLNQLIQWLSYDQVDLLGYSFGGELALEYAYHYPKTVRSMVLSSPSLLTLKVTDVTQIAGFMSVVNIEMMKDIEALLSNSLPIDRVLDQIWETIDIDTVDRFLFEDQAIAKKNRQLWEQSNLPNTGLMAKALRKHPMAPPLEDRLKAIQHKVLILTGVHDRNTGMPISRIIHRELPNSQWELFYNSAHFPDLEEPEKFTELVIKFLKSL
ncbi:proline iminopeptidase [Pullulanibacillus pueri]|uniref:Proline iminopeptidase n=1 Tax=Pullulanibacillus pueri TaxID=1437324 RepID=A0A8J2ZV54_9BACL|nr:alpha/beta fold hydrolase [Pullulanibacillus pueri]MBM7681371.1 proline iminopeptidase [Pullulanibacillus pueri]GGH78614.1 proline iminopeptidase [Pullulanibacillus pueri]